MPLNPVSHQIMSLFFAGNLLIGSWQEYKTYNLLSRNQLEKDLEVFKEVLFFGKKYVW